MIENVKKQVYQLLNNDCSGHGMDHVNRVLELSLKFAEIENANQEVVALIALLHDVDDYKLFGVESAINLTNTKKILNHCLVEASIQEHVLSAIKTIGYSKRLSNIQPKTLEGMIVSDADMCDSIGATGILRSYQYNLAHQRVFFDKDIYPELDMSQESYMAKKDGTVVTHMFEKLLRLKDLMLTDAGKKEAEKRHQFMVEFLYRFFKEENAVDWITYLDDYLIKNSI